MISENKMRSLLIILAMLLSSTSLAFGPQSSNKNVLWGFDFVEEFDGLQDWSPNYRGCCGYVQGPTGYDYLPRLADGSRSAWVMYSGQQSPASWIGGVDEDKPVWRGTKVGTIDMGSSSGTARGPTRLAVYFGDPLNQVAQPDAGYDDWSIFYMTWIPRNNFPTSCSSGIPGSTNCVGQYTDGGQYLNFAYYKAAHASIGCGVDGDNRPETCQDGQTYGIGRFVLNYAGNSYTNTASGQPPGMHYKILPSGVPEQVPYVFAREGSTNLNGLLGDWYGFEMRVRNSESRTSFFVSVWVYDRDGNQIAQMTDREFSNPITASHPYKWDHYTFGGNVSYSFGSTMDSAYFIDDVIIDGWDDEDGPIGPRYFAAIAQDNIPVSKPNAATNFSYTTRSRDAVVAGGATRGNLTQCPDGKWATVCKATVYDVRINCTNPTTRVNGNSFLPAGILTLDWIFEPTGDGKTHSVKVPRCPFLVDLPPGTYTVKQRTVLTHSGDGKIGNWSQISGSMEVPAP